MILTDSESETANRYLTTYQASERKQASNEARSESDLMNGQKRVFVAWLGKTLTIGKNEYLRSVRRFSYQRFISKWLVSTS